MSYLPSQGFDVSIVTRVRLKTWAGVSYTIQAGVVSWAVYSALALLHLVTGLLFILNTASGEAVGFHRLPLDDAWVQLVYARSFAESFTFAYNPGSPEAGATSPLWVILVGLTYKVFAFTGVSLPAVAKLLGVFLALGASVVALNLVQAVTGRRVLGVAAAAVIALEPGYSFAKVSGIEASLFGFLALAAAAAFYHQRLALTGGLLALAVAARPEGVLLVGLTLAALAVKLLWERGDFRLIPQEDIANVLKAAVPPALMALAIAVSNILVNGTPYPNSYLVKHVPLGLFHWPNLWNLAQGYLFQTSFFSAAGIAATVPLLLLAAIKYTRQSRFAAVPLIAFPLVLYYALSTMLPLEPGHWGIAMRRYLDPTLPFVVVGLIVGLYYARRLLGSLGASLRRGTPGSATPRQSPPGKGGGLDGGNGKRPLALKRGSTGARWASLGLTLLFVLLAAMPYAVAPGRWVTLMNDYSRNSQNVHHVNVAAAQWTNDHLPPDAVVGTLDGGALRFFGGHRVVDLSGVNTHTAIGKPLFGAAEEHGVDYLVAFRNIYLDSWPLGKEIVSFATPRNTRLPGPELVVYRANWDWPIDLADKSIPHAIDTAGLRLLDSLDVGMSAQEEVHSYSPTQPGGLVEWIFHVARDNGASVDIRDEARASMGSEEFVTRSEPGRPLIIAKRYDAAAGGSVAVYVDGKFVGDWRLAPRDFAFGEDTFWVGPEQITGATTQLRFRPLQRSGTTLTSFYYWVYTKK